MALALGRGRGGGRGGFGGFDEEGPAFEEAGNLAAVADVEMPRSAGGFAVEGFQT